MLSDFGIVNVMTGTDTEVEMRFVETGTDNPTVLENIAFSLYDMDEGKKGKGRVSMQLCDAVGAAFPADSELAVYESEGCYHITSCLRGAKGNEPSSVAAVGVEGAKRTASFWFERAARLSFKLEVTEGFGGRNFMFAFEPSNACQPSYEVDFLPPSCCPAESLEDDCDNAVIDFVPPEPLPIETTTTTTTTTTPEPGQPPKPPPSFCKARCPKRKRCCFAKNGKRTVFMRKRDGRHRDRCLAAGRTWCTSTGKKLVGKPNQKPKGSKFCRKRCNGARCCFERKKGRAGKRGLWKKTKEYNKKAAKAKRRSQAKQCIRGGSRYCAANGVQHALR